MIEFGETQFGNCSGMVAAMRVRLQGGALVVDFAAIGVEVRTGLASDRAFQPMRQGATQGGRPQRLGLSSGERTLSCEQVYFDSVADHERKHRLVRAVQFASIAQVDGSGRHVVPDVTWNDNSPSWNDPLALPSEHWNVNRQEVRMSADSLLGRGNGNKESRELIVASTPSKECEWFGEFAQSCIGRPWHFEFGHWLGKIELSAANCQGALVLVAAGCCAGFDLRILYDVWHGELFETGASRRVARVIGELPGDFATQQATQVFAALTT